MKYNTVCNTCKQEHKGFVSKCLRCYSRDIHHVRANEGISTQEMQAFKESMKELED